MGLSGRLRATNHVHPDFFLQDIPAREMHLLRGERVYHGEIFVANPVTGVSDWYWVVFPTRHCELLLDAGAQIPTVDALSSPRIVTPFDPAPPPAQLAHQLIRLRQAGSPYYLYAVQTRNFGLVAGQGVWQGECYVPSSGWQWQTIPVEEAFYYPPAGGHDWYITP